MIVVMSTEAKQEQVNNVLERISDRRMSGHVSPGAERSVIGVVGVVGQDIQELMAHLEMLPGVEEVVRISKPFKLSGREYHPEDTIIHVGGVTIGDGSPVVFAGPCAVEDEEQVMETAHAVKKAGANVLRGGAFKPRTSPYGFRGLGIEGLKLLSKAGKATGMPIITEVMAPQQVEVVAEYADILQVGARNMQNFNLLDEVGKVNKPVMLKRGFAATIDDWLLASEYILSQGNRDVMLCERGIRTFDTYARNTFDVNAIPIIRKESHLPIIADPSHGTGKWWMVTPVALGAVIAGADGLIIEVHPRPDEAKSDGPQSLTFDNFNLLMDQMRVVAPLAVGHKSAALTT